MHNLHKSKQKKRIIRRGVSSLIVIIAIVVAIAIFTPIVYLAIPSNEPSVITTKSTITANEADNSEQKSKVQENTTDKRSDIKNTVKMRKKSDYMPGTTHNYEADAWAYPTKDVNGWTMNPSSYTGEEKVVFLTFDDGPDLSHTPNVLDILKNYGVHATFFLVGKNADSEDALPIIKRQISEGNAIGLHSYSHDYSFLYPGRVANSDNIMKEIYQSEEVIRKAIGNEYKATLFRYPGGHMSWKNVSSSDEVLASNNIYSIDWNALTGDAVGKNDPMYSQDALTNIKTSMQIYGNPKIVVVLMHDIKSKSTDALPQIIEYFSDLGYKFGILE